MRIGTLGFDVKVVKRFGAIKKSFPICLIIIAKNPGTIEIYDISNLHTTNYRGCLYYQHVRETASASIQNKLKPYNSAKYSTMLPTISHSSSKIYRKTLSCSSFIYLKLPPHWLLPGVLEMCNTYHHSQTWE